MTITSYEFSNQRQSTPSEDYAKKVPDATKQFRIAYPRGIGENFRRLTERVYETARDALSSIRDAYSIPKRDFQYT